MTTLQSERIVIKLTSHSPAQHPARVFSGRRRSFSLEVVLGAWGLDCGAWSQSKEQNRTHKIYNQCTWRCIKHARVDCKSLEIIDPYSPLFGPVFVRKNRVKFGLERAQQGCPFSWWMTAKILKVQSKVKRKTLHMSMTLSPREVKKDFTIAKALSNLELTDCTGEWNQPRETLETRLKCGQLKMPLNGKIQGVPKVRSSSS